MLEASLKSETHHFDPKAKYVWLACFKHIALSLRAPVNLTLNGKFEYRIVF